MGKFILKTAKDGQSYFNLKAGNGQTILVSEMYRTRQSCQNGIDSVKENASRDERYEKKTSSNGKFFFNLKAGNGQIIGNSELYDTEAGRDAGIESVKTTAPVAATVEE